MWSRIRQHGNQRIPLLLVLLLDLHLRVVHHHLLLEVEILGKGGGGKQKASARAARRWTVGWDQIGNNAATCMLGLYVDLVRLFPRLLQDKIAHLPQLLGCCCVVHDDERVGGTPRRYRLDIARL